MFIKLNPPKLVWLHRIKHLKEEARLSKARSGQDDSPELESTALNSLLNTEASLNEPKKNVSD